MKQRVADYIVETLLNRGVTDTFMLAGGGMMHLVDAIGRSHMRYVCHHHEQSASMAADAYARLRGLGAVFVTSGPGATNALTGLAGAWLDSSPVVFISGQAKRSQTIRHHGLDGLRQFGTFEVDIIPVVRSITKAAIFLDDASQVRFELERAIALAQSARQGPVWIDIPVDVQGALVDPGTLAPFEAPERHERAPTEAELRELLRVIRLAERPLLLAGHGVKAARRIEPFRRLVDILAIPVATTPFAVDLLPHDHPLFVGHPSAKGDRAGNFAVQNADLIVSLGQSFHVLTTGYDTTTFSPDSRRIMIDVDPHVLRRQEIRIDQHFLWSVEDFVDQALERWSGAVTSHRSGPNAWQGYGAYLKSRFDVMREPHRRTELGDSKSINYYDVVDALARQCDDDAVFVTDAGLAFYLVGQALKTKPRQQVINSGGLGTMGFALPAAIGAATALPGRQVVCITGDGSLQTSVHDLATLSCRDFRVIVVVVNNDGYVSIRNTQDNYFQGLRVGSSTVTGVSIPALEKLCSAYGLRYHSARALSKLAPVLTEALCEPMSSVVEFFVPAACEVIPSVSSRKRDDGTMESTPLHDMYPFLERDDLRAVMFNRWRARQDETDA
jgi:acetolactate synthase-1/2/3 large subunit